MMNEACTELGPIFKPEKIFNLIDKLSFAKKVLLTTTCPRPVYRGMFQATHCKPPSEATEKGIVEPGQVVLSQSSTLKVRA